MKTSIKRLLVPLKRFVDSPTHLVSVAIICNLLEDSKLVVRDGQDVLLATDLSVNHLLGWVTLVCCLRILHLYVYPKPSEETA